VARKRAGGSGQHRRKPTTRLKVASVLDKNIQSNIRIDSQQGRIDLVGQARSEHRLSDPVAVASAERAGVLVRISCGSFPASQGRGQERSLALD